MRDAIGACLVGEARREPIGVLDAVELAARIRQRDDARGDADGRRRHALEPTRGVAEAVLLGQARLRKLETVQPA